jgi:acyl-CoA synthetase (AMP-forming)/AMP-acid ligase II
MRIVVALSMVVGVAAPAAADVARWWLPDRWTFLTEIPKTSVGKFDKKLLRAREAKGALRILDTGVDACR